MSKPFDSNGKKPAAAAKPNRLGSVAEWADERVGLAGLAKKNLRKVFPDHWSFMLGEIAMLLILNSFPRCIHPRQNV